jgi:hypothetical protein
MHVCNITKLPHPHIVGKLDKKPMKWVFTPLKNQLQKPIFQAIDHPLGVFSDDSKMMIPKHTNIYNTL